MKKWLVLTLALLILPMIYNESLGEKSTFFDSVKFIQYLDENTALEEVKNNNLSVVEYSHSAGFESYRKGLGEYYKNVGKHHGCSCKTGNVNRKFLFQHNFSTTYSIR